MKHCTQSTQNDCHQWLSGSFKVHQIRFWPGLRPGPHWGSLQRSPHPLAGLGGNGDRGKDREEERKERGWTPPPLLTQILDPSLDKLLFFCVVYFAQKFISRASDEIQSLFSLHLGTSDEFNDVVQYFGENPRDTTSSEWFSDIAVFVNKFEVATTSTFAFQKHDTREGKSPSKLAPYKNTYNYEHKFNTNITQILAGPS